MCVVSMITEHYELKWPLTQRIPFDPLGIHDVPLPRPLEYFDFLELVRKAKEYDRMTNQPDCPDAEKLKWMAELEKRMVETYNLTKPAYAPQDPDRSNQTEPS